MCSVVKQVTEYGSLFICTCILFIYICIPFTDVWREADHSIRLPVYLHLYSVYLQLYLEMCSGLKQVTV